MSKQEIVRMHDELMTNGFPIEDGFTVVAKEVPVPTGRIDILGRSAENRLTIVELKTSRSGGGHCPRATCLGQLRNEGKGLNQLLQLCGYPAVSLRYILIEYRNCFGTVKEIAHETWESDNDLQRAT